MFPPRDASLCGLASRAVDPGAAILDRPRQSEKTISLPSAVQAGLAAPQFSKVIRFASPAGLSPSEKGRYQEHCGFFSREISNECDEAAVR